MLCHQHSLSYLFCYWSAINVQVEEVVKCINARPVNTEKEVFALMQQFSLRPDQDEEVGLARKNKGLLKLSAASISGGFVKGFCIIWESQSPVRSNYHRGTWPQHVRQEARTQCDICVSDTQLSRSAAKHDNFFCQGVIISSRLTLPPPTPSPPIMVFWTKEATQT